MMTESATLIAAAHQAVHQASVVTRAVQRELSAHQAIQKGDSSPVTIADFAAQAVVHRELRARLGAQAFLAEEHSAYLRAPERRRLLLSTVNAARLAWPDCTGDDLLSSIDEGLVGPERAELPGRYWTLDPIDGTKGFIRGQQYSICLALVEHGRVVLAALGCPNLSADWERPFADPDAHGLIFLATEDGPVMTAACDRAPSGVTLSRLPAAAARDPDAPIRLCGSYSSSRQSEGAAARVLARLKGAGIAVVPPSRLDSQVKYAVVARGQMDVFLRMPRSADHEENVWDHAPGSLIAARAGVKVTDCLDAPLNFAGGAVLRGNRGLFVARADVHARLLPFVRAEAVE
jgi:3'(2'), 5'-bisphosphate nucleotidase